MKTHTAYWIKHLKKDPEYFNLRFKRLNTNTYHPYEIYENLLDEVDLEEFVNIEQDRIPLFMGIPMCGIVPNPKSINGFLKEKRIIAVLGKATFSDVISGLSLYNYDGDNMKRIIFFENNP